jgi:hypothetical protein
MVEAFISHSKKDIELVTKIYKALYQAGITPKLAEFEELGERDGLSAPQIKNMIMNSSWTLVFLTPNVIASDHTRDWVAYEVGVSHGLGRPVWIFEDDRVPIEKFPVPYLDYYFLYDSLNQQDWDAIKEEMAKYARFPDWGPAIVGAILGASFGKEGAALGGLLGYTKSVADLSKMKAQAPSGFHKVAISCLECNSQYTVIGKYKTITVGFTCPTCRKMIALI